MRVLPLLALIVAPALAACVGPADPKSTADAAGVGAASDAAFDFARALWEHGYVELPDGAKLRYVAILPAEGRFPTLLEYGGYAPPYNEGLGIGLAQRSVSRGYAYVGVQLRGSGCSSGDFAPLSPTTAADGFSAVEWAATQPWSTGDVGMVGYSYHGFSQVVTAAARPPHLRAIAAGAIPGDLYRDLAYPGGIPNPGSLAVFTGLSTAAGPAAEATAAGFPREECTENLAPAERLGGIPLLGVAEERFDGALYHDVYPPDILSKIEVPLFTVHGWQDDILLPGMIHGLARSSGPWWATLSNGDHSLYAKPPSLARMEAFLDRFVKGSANGFEERPRVAVDWEIGTDLAARWNTTEDAWPPAATRPWRLNLSDGSLGEKEGRGSTTWLAALPGPVNPATSVSRDDVDIGGLAGPALVPAPTRVVWRSEPLAEDVVLLGSANLSLWIRTDAPDVDVQVTLREVRDDGAVLVQRGWLRASHRALDGERSTPLVPRHPHDAAEPLPRGEPTELAIGIPPFGHVFRAGSRIEVGLDAPQLAPEFIGFASVSAAVVEILHDADHPSSILLPLLAGARAEAPAPACGALLRQPCQPVDLLGGGK